MITLDRAELDRRAEAVIADYGGICAPHEAFYIRSISYSSARASDAFLRLDVARAVRDSADNQVSAVHEALGHAAALSRFSWPSGVGFRRSSAQERLKMARAAKLRAAFDVGDASPLRSRGLRNALEHFDERLDSFVLRVEAGYFFPDAIVADSTLADAPTSHIFKLLDPERSCFVLLGEKHDYGSLRNEVERIHQRATALDRAGGRLAPLQGSDDGA